MIAVTGMDFGEPGTDKSTYTVFDGEGTVGAVLDEEQFRENVAWLLSQAMRNPLLELTR